MSLLASLFGRQKPAAAGAAREPGHAAEGKRSSTAQVETQANSAESLAARARALADECRFAEAHDYFLRAEAGGIRTGTHYRELGWSAFCVGRVAQAEGWLRKALAVQADDWATHFKLARVLLAHGKATEAATHCTTALEHCPEHFEVLLALAECAMQTGDTIAAEASVRAAQRADPERAEGWDRLGAVCVRQGRHGEALEAFERAAALDARRGGGLDCFANVAIELTEAGRPQDAIALCERMLPAQPSVDGHYAYGLALLTAGRLADAWPHYEFRHLRPAALSRRNQLSRPPWSGQDLGGKTILLRSEQGYGDVIQFLRFAPRLKALGATVLLETFAGFEDVAGSCPGIDAVLQAGPLPHYDFHLYLMSLPRVFGTDQASIPAEVPYLRADPRRTTLWAARLGEVGRPRVGLAWAGSPDHPKDRYRSVPLQSLSPLLGIEGVQFVSLQKSAAVAEPGAAPFAGMLEVGADLKDFSDTAAVIGHLDLVVCVDTSIAHLAGAMGKEVWLLLPKPADWRWMEGREDTPWYPTMRLFRQQERGDWGGVIERLAAALTQRVAASKVGGAWRGLPSPKPPTSSSVAVGGARSRRPSSASLSAVSETRHGIVQYFPGDAGVGTSLAAYGEFLQGQLDLLAKIVRPGANILEIGAGVGAGSLFLAAAVGPGGHLLLYEPRAVLQRLLGRNLAANGVANATILQRRFTAPSDAVATGPAPPGSAAALSDATGAIVQTVDELQLKRLNWIKINDGADATAILAGAQAALWQLRPALFVAAEDESALAVLADHLKTFGYRCFRMATPYYSPQNFFERGDDIFEGRVALAVLAIPEEVEIDIALEGCREL